MLKDQTMKHFLQTYVYAETGDAEIARHILGLLWSINYGEQTGASHSSDNPAIAEFLKRHEVKNFLGKVDSIFSIGKFMDRAELYSLLKHPFDMQTTILESDERKVAYSKLELAEIITHWAAVTMTIFEGKGKLDASIIRGAFEIHNRVQNYMDRVCGIVVFEQSPTVEQLENYERVFRALPHDLKSAAGEIREIVEAYGTITNPDHKIEVLNRRLTAEMDAEVARLYGRDAG